MLSTSVWAPPHESIYEGLRRETPEILLARKAVPKKLEVSPFRWTIFHGSMPSRPCMAASAPSRNSSEMRLGTDKATVTLTPGGSEKAGR